METTYKTLADVYTAILKGEIDPTKYYLVADSGDMMIYPHKEGEAILRTYEDDAFDFVASILGMRRENP